MKLSSAPPLLKHGGGGAIVHSPLFVAYLHVHMSFLGELGHLICPLIYGRIFPQILGKHQIFPQFQWQIRPQNWWIPKFVLKFWDKFVPKFGESPN